MATITPSQIIDSTYFTGEILLTNKTALTDDLTQSINQYGKEILISLLGYSLYKSMMSDSTSEPYKSLIEGAEFEMTFDGITQTLKWEGLKNTALESLIAYYVYYKYQERNITRPSGIGIIKPKAENSEVDDPTIKMTNAWNRMIELYGFFPYSWFRDTSAKIIQPDGSLIYDNAPSAYNYLCANIDDFSSWIFQPLPYINPFGI